MTHRDIHLKLETLALIFYIDTICISNSTFANMNFNISPISYKVLGKLLIVKLYSLAF